MNNIDETKLIGISSNKFTISNKEKIFTSTWSKVKEDENYDKMQKKYNEVVDTNIDWDIFVLESDKTNAKTVWFKFENANVKDCTVYVPAGLSLNVYRQLAGYMLYIFND